MTPDFRRASGNGISVMFGSLKIVFSVARLVTNWLRTTDPEVNTLEGNALGHTQQRKGSGGEATTIFISFCHTIGN